MSELTPQQINNLNMEDLNKLLNSGKYISVTKKTLINKRIELLKKKIFIIMIVIFQH